MISEQLENIKKVLATFDGNKNGEPKNEVEIYILKSLWVMLCADFEGCLKEIIYDYVEKIKDVKDILKIHPLLVIRNSFGNKKFTIEELCETFNGHLNKDYTISKYNFVETTETCYKSYPIEKIFNRLGLFFDSEEKTTVRSLDSIASTRDSVAHGDRNISITRKELEQNIDKIEEIYHLLANKLQYSHFFKKKPLARKSKKIRLSSIHKKKTKAHK